MNSVISLEVWTAKLQQQAAPSASWARLNFEAAACRAGLMPSMSWRSTMLLASLQVHLQASLRVMLLMWPSRNFVNLKQFSGCGALGEGCCALQCRHARVFQALTVLVVHLHLRSIHRHQEICLEQQPYLKAVCQSMRERESWSRTQHHL